MTFEAGAVVVVPFPFTDRATTKRRPALILSDHAAFGRETGQYVLAMITSAKASVWPFDVTIADRASAGLDVPCVVRMKLFTLDGRLIVRKVGMLAMTDRRAVRGAVDTLFGI